MSQDDIETLREGMRLARTFAAEWGERDAALDRIEAELDRLRDELRDWEERTDGFTREATEKEEAK